MVTRISTSSKKFAGNTASWLKKNRKCIIIFYVLLKDLLV